MVRNRFRMCAYSKQITRVSSGAPLSHRHLDTFSVLSSFTGAPYFPEFAMFENVRRSSSLDGLWIVALVLVSAVAGLVLMLKAYTSPVPSLEGNQCEIVCRPAQVKAIKG